MKLLRAAASAAVAVSVLATPAFAQQSQGNAPAAQAPRVTPQSGEMSDAMVRKVGTALRHVASIRQTYAQRAQSANTQQQLQDLDKQAQKEMVKAIDDQGLSVQQYSQAIEMARADPKLKQRVVSAAEQAGE